MYAFDTCFFCRYSMPVGFDLDDPRWDHPLVCRKNTTHPDIRFPLLWPVVNADFACDNFEEAPRMKGLIALWSGSIASIPEGWHLCDGDEGTPDLRDRFVVGAGDSYAVAETGGDIEHNHTGSSGTSSFYLNDGSGVAAGTDLKRDGPVHGVGLEIDNSNHLPPYYAVCYIMHL